MKSDRWSQIGKLFDAVESMSTAERGEWLRDACGDDETLRAELEHLVDHDRQANRDGFLDQPDLANPGDQPTGFWPPVDGRRPVAGPDVSRHAQTAPDNGTDRFSPKPAITSAPS